MATRADARRPTAETGRDEASSTSRIRCALQRPVPSFAALAFLLALVLAAVPGVAAPGVGSGQAAGPLNIAVIMSYDPALPWSRSFLAGLSEAREAYGGRVEYFVESLDRGRFPDADALDRFRLYLAGKYAGRKMSAVIVESYAAASFMQQCGESIFGDVPYVVISSEPRERFSFGRFAMISNRPWVERTVRLALEQNPKAGRMLVVGDGSNPARALTDQILKVVQATGRDMTVDTLDTFTLPELEKTAAGMPRDSLVIFTLAFRDRDGNTLVPRDVMGRLAAVSTPPVYGYLETFLGTGMVGGYLYCGDATARLAVSMALELAAGRVPDAAYEPAEATFDWRALKRWSIPEKILPAGSLIRFKPDSFLDRYFVQAVAVAGFVLAETVLVAVLIRLYTQRRRLTGKLMQAKALLEDRVAERTRELERLAVTDELTGLANRRELARMAELEAMRAGRGGPAFSLVLIDVDHFKDINDRLGHEAGDRVLRAVAGLLAGHLRGQDTLARWGGEEFLALLPDTSLEKAVLAASKLRDMLADDVVRVDGGTAMAVTASFGVACWDEAPDGVDEILRLADARLYLAKGRGRNQVCWKSEG